MKKYFPAMITLMILQLAFTVAVFAESAGSINCSSVSRGDRRYDSKLTIQKAMLSTSTDGFVLTLKIQSRGDTIKYFVSPDLTIQGINHSGDKSNSKLLLSKNGSFSFSDMPRSQKICEAKGKLIFGQGVKQKIFLN
jgi:hypothetical protein